MGKQKEYLRYDGGSVLKNTEIGARGRRREASVTWGAPLTLRQRKSWGKVSGKRRNGEIVKGLTLNDYRRREYEKRVSIERSRLVEEDNKIETIQEQKKFESKRRELERRLERVRDLKDQRNPQEVGKLYSQSPFSVTVTQHKHKNVTGILYETQIIKVSRALIQKQWGRGKLQRRDELGRLKSSDRSMRMEVSQAGGLCIEERVFNNQ